MNALDLSENTEITYMTINKSNSLMFVAAGKDGIKKIIYKYFNYKGLIIYLMDL